MLLDAWATGPAELIGTVDGAICSTARASRRADDLPRRWWCAGVAAAVGLDGPRTRVLPVHKGREWAQNSRSTIAVDRIERAIERLERCTCPRWAGKQLTSRSCDSC